MSEFKNLPEYYLLSNPNQIINQPSEVIPVSVSHQLTIGRSHQNSLQIVDNTISKKHAKISFLSGSFYILDLASANGILVNGEKIQKQHKLETNDSIQFGKFSTLYKFVDRSGKSRSKGKSKINLKDYLFQEKDSTQQKGKATKNLDEMQSILTQPINQGKSHTQMDGKARKTKAKESRIKIPDLSDYLKLANVGEEQLDNQTQAINSNQSMQQKFARKRNSKEGVVGKEGRIKLNSLQEVAPTEEQLKSYRLEKRERNIFVQQQEALQKIEEHKKRVEEDRLKKQLEQAQIAEDLLQKQLLLEQQVKQEQDKIRRQKQKLEQQFIRKEQLKRQQQLLKLKSIQDKEREMMAKIEDERIKQIEQLKRKQEIIKQQSDNQYKKQYDKRKRQLEMEAEALAKQYQSIYRETIKKVRTQIDNEENTINQMQQKELKLTQQKQQLDFDIKKLQQEIQEAKVEFIQVNGRNKACILYASDIQDKIDSLGFKQLKAKQDGYFKGNPNNNVVIRKLIESIQSSRKLLKIKQKEYQNIVEQINSLSASIKQQQYSSSSEVSNFIDTINENRQVIERLKSEYLELVEEERSIQEIWQAQLQENSQLQSTNRVLENQINKNIRQIDESLRDQIKKSTQQRLHMLKVMHFCPEQKKNAAKFLIEQMLNIQQQIHNFTKINEEQHKKIGKIIAQTEKIKRQNQYLSEILFSHDENGHHFDNMKVVINNLIDKISEEKSVDTINDCLKMANEAVKYELLIQGEVQRKKSLKENMRKIGEMGLAPPQMKSGQKNPLVFFGDLLTNKQIEIEKKKSMIQGLHNQMNNTKGSIRLLEQKKHKISQALQKYKIEQLSEARKYLGKDHPLPFE